MKSPKKWLLLPKSVLRQRLLLLDSRRRLPVRRRAEEQTGTLHRLEQVAEVASVRGITVIFDVLSVRRVG